MNNSVNGIGCPPLGYLNLGAFRSPVDKGKYHYDSDCGWFTANAKRIATVRSTMHSFGEAHIALSKNRAPQLHSLVIQLSPQFHLELPIHRGEPMWQVKPFGDAFHAVVPSDGEIWAIARRSCQTLGMTLEDHALYRAHIQRALAANEATEKQVN